MKNSSILTIAPALIIGLGACGNSGKKSKEPETQQPEVCTWSYDAAATTVSWTAYKFTEMAGVGGKFDDFSITGTEEKKERQHVMENARFSIPVSGVNTNNPDRDQKIREHFFGTLDSMEAITGTVTKVQGNEEMGSVFLKLSLNNMEKAVELEYMFSGDTLKISGVINVNDWEAGAGIEKLNSVCKDLHTGTDGKSVLHPNVRLDIHSVLKKTCE